MAFEIIKEIYEREHRTLGAAELAVLQAVGYHADLVTRRAWPSNSLLASETGYHQKTVGQAVGRLVTRGYLRSKMAANYRRTLWITDPEDWAEAPLRVESRTEGVEPCTEGVESRTEGGTVQDSRGTAQRGENQSLTSQVNQSLNQEGTTTAPKGRVNRPSLGEREISTKDLPTLLQQMTEAAAEKHEVETVLEIDPIRLRSRLGQIMHHYRLTPADLVWMYDWFTRKTASRWGTLNSHPLQWFTTNREIEDLAEVMRNKRAKDDVDEAEGVNC